MNQLVFVKDQKVVTDSLLVASTFGKDHSRVMRDIRELECSEDFRVGNFAESTYTNNQDREYPKFIMTEKGFTLLVMGYTGKDAMRFKEQYIKEFHRMREQLNKPMSIEDMIITQGKDFEEAMNFITGWYPAVKKQFKETR